MALTKVEKIWMNGKWVAWDDARIHILSHVAHYASSVFEGIRAYSQRSNGAAIFRLDEHMDRLMGSAKIYRMELPYTREQIRTATLDVVAVNELTDCYIRPLIYRGYENLGVNPFGSPVEVAVAAEGKGLRVVARVKTTGQTGVEMEALTAVSVACLTIYDMLKAAEKGMVIEEVRLVAKSGGASGDWTAP